MSGVNFLNVDTQSVEVEEGRPAADRILEGEPRFLTWNAEDSGDGVYAGIWEASKGKWLVSYDEWEFCHIIEGHSVLSEDGGKAHVLKKGDSFVIRPGFKGSWEVIETTRKHYVIREL